MRYIFAILLLFLPDLAAAQSVQRVVPGFRLPRGYEQLTLSTGNSTPLASIPSQTNNPITLVVIYVEGAAVGFRDDATAMTITSAAANSLFFNVGILSSSTNDTVVLQEALLQLCATAN